MTSARSSITVGLLWHSFWSDNLGVGALSESQVAICEVAAARARVDLRFIVFGTSGGRDYMPTGKNIRRGSQSSLRQMLLGRSPFLRELEDCDLVLDVGEGDSFTDIYGMRRFRVHMASKIAVLIKRIPLVLSPQTIGPFERRYTRWLALQVMRRCARVFSRDGLSTQYLQSMDVRNNVTEAIDMAFRLPYVKPDRSGSGTCRIGINVSGLLFSGGYTGSNQFGLTLDYPRLVRDLLEHWTADPSVEIWLIGHVLSDEMPRDDDRAAIAALAKDFPNARVAPQFCSPSQAKSFIAGLDFLTGARMHACIAAMSSGVPVVPLAYSRKFNGLFTTLGYQWLADGKSMTNEQALSAITSGFQRRMELRENIEMGMKAAEERLCVYENYLTKIFESITPQAVRRLP